MKVPGAVEVVDLAAEAVASLTWAGSAVHLDAVAREVARAARGEVVYLALRAGGEVVGYGGVDLARSPGVGVLFQLTVHPSLRGRGLGSAPIAALEAAAAVRGADRVELSVELDNPRARSLCERLGYRPIGETVEEWAVEDAAGAVVTHRARCTVLTRHLTRHPTR